MRELNLLINIIIKTYFSDLTCLVYTYNSPLDIIHIENVPALFDLQLNNLTYVEHSKCKLFLLQVTNATKAFEVTEDLLRKADGIYNDRKYIIVLYYLDDMYTFFMSSELNFMRDVLLIDISNYNTFLDEHDLHFDLYTHKYIGELGNNDKILIDIWYANNSFKYGNNLFPNKISNQQGRALKAACLGDLPFSLCSSYDPPLGHEHNFIIHYAKKFNFTLQLQFEEFTNGTEQEEKFYKKIICAGEDYSEILYGGFPAHPLKYRHQYDLVPSVGFTEVVTVPLPIVKYGYLMFFRVLDPYVWFSIMVVLILSRGILYIRCSQQQEVTHVSTLIVFGFLLQQSTSLSRLKQDVCIMYIMSLLLFAGVLITTAFNSRLASVFIKPILEHNINTLTELADSDLHILLLGYLENLLISDERVVYKQLLQKSLIIHDRYDDDNVNSRISTGKYAVHISRFQSGYYLAMTPKILQLIKGKYKPITPNLLNDNYYIHLRRNSVHNYELQTFIRNALETGLLFFWEKKAIRYAIAYQNETFLQKISDFDLNLSNALLGLQHLKGAFVVWGCGIIISVIVLLCEIYSGRNRTN